MKKTIYFADLVHNGTIKSIDTFPLGIGFVASYFQKKHPDVEIKMFKLPQDLNEALLNKMPTIMCFSNFTWNLNLSMEFAKYIKSVNKNIPIVFGGPNIPIVTEECEEFLKKYSEIDFYIKFDGEHAFENLYRKLVENDFDIKKVKKSDPYKLDNTLFIHDNNIFEGQVKRITDLMSVPSPYTMGFMDKFFTQDLRPLVEWTRGCPFSCTFCNDAVSIRNKIYRKTFEYVDEELEYIGKKVKENNLYADLSIADLNFGMFKEDLQIAKKIRKVSNRYSWPRSIDTSLGKSQPERVLETVNILNSGDQPLYKMYSALQSTDPIVLDAIRRKNLPVEKIKSLKGESNLEKSKTGFFSELILGLPKESKKSHFQSLRDAIDKMNVDSLDVHQLNLAKGAPMETKTERNRFKFNSKFRIFVGRIGNYKIGNKNIAVGEHDEVVVGTKDLSYKDWLECRQVDFLVKVYLDRAYFSEIFEFISHLGLSKFDLLLTVYEKFIRKNKKLNDLLNYYLSKVEEVLHDNLEDFDKFVSNEENVQKYKNGQIGGNELTIGRAKMYTEALEELHEVLEKSAEYYLSENNLGSFDNIEYIKEAIRFSYNRKFEFSNFTKKTKESFKFDFIKASNSNYKINPADIRLKNNKKEIEFYYSESALDDLQYAIKSFVYKGAKNDIFNIKKIDINKIKENIPEGQLNYNLGKFFHQVNMSVLKRNFNYT
tara:strand:+ start:2136 stop:4268 length:2133 start_codon:yes stop_codon:yes gene_type:complete